MKLIRSLVRNAGVLALVFACSGTAWAADNLVLGKKLIIKNPTGNEQNRALIMIAKEPLTDVFFANAPAPTSASLRVVLNGSSGSGTTYTLGAPGVWQTAGGGLKYTGGDPVKLVFMKFTGSGSFILKVKAKGSAGPAFFEPVPPNTGTDGGIILTIEQGSGPRTYCVGFGGAFGGDPVVNGPTMYKVINPTNQGCPVFGTPESESDTVGAGGSTGTDTEADGATPTDPIETSVTTPTGGAVQIDEGALTAPDPTGFELLGQSVDVTAPAESASDPLVLIFQVDLSAIPAGRDPLTIDVFRDGAEVEPCLGDPGTAFPDPCVAERTIIGDDLRITVLSTHASTWVVGLPLCGNGSLNAGETCDPPGAQAQCSVGQVCKSDCQCGTPCDCCALNPSAYELTTGIGAGSCGTAVTSSGGLFANLACNGAYFGGGGNSVPLPFPMPDQVRLRMNVASCNSTTEQLTLTAATQAQTGSIRNCTEQGCLFGPPLPIPGAVAPLSVCGLLTVADDATGTSSCDGITDIALPLTMELFLTGDTANDPSGSITGVQPCPLCSGGTCRGGPNNGMACVAASSDLGDSYPTSRDCPPDPMYSIGTVPIGAAFTTGTATAVGTPTGPEVHKTRVFCGYCRDFDGTGSFQNPAQPCIADAQCAQPFESCEQRTNGAFGPAGGAVKTITLTGTGATCLADGDPHPSTLVGGTCIAPTFEPTVDAASDLPGPAAYSLQGDARLIGPPAPCGCGPAAPSTLTFTTSLGSGGCGEARNANGTLFDTVDCGNLYWGGGGYSFPIPYRLVDLSTSIADVTSCSSGVVTLAGRTAAATGSNKTCTTAGCLFGPPTPMPNVSSTPTSHCLVYSLASNASGTADCATGSTTLNVPLAAAIYLTGDSVNDPTSSMPGIQPCPLCSGGTCRGGPNNGMICTPAGTDIGDSYQTSHDCPPDPVYLLNSPPPLQISLTTGTVSWTGTPATNDTGATESLQTRVFSGYCRDLALPGGTGSFADPAQHCWENGMAVGPACSNAGGGFDTCEQRTNGAFGPNGGAVRTITTFGVPAGSLTDNLPHAATLGSLFAVGPTFDATVDAALDLPSPGTITLQGSIQVQ